MRNKSRKIEEDKTTINREYTKDSRQEMFEVFLVEFGYECAEIVKDDVLKELQIILKRMLHSYFKE